MILVAQARVASLDGDEAIIATTNVSHLAPFVAALHRLDGARLFVDIHDDDSLIFEARDPALVRAVFGRALGSIVARALAPGVSANERPIAPLPDDFVDYIWNQAPHFECRVVETPGKQSRVRVAVGNSEADRRLSFGPLEPGPAPVCRLDYAAERDQWMLRYG
jgi:hypothetical protein